MKILGFAKPTIRWFTQYLSNRQQIVVSGEKQSTAVKTSRGIAQGTVLGPLGFLIYVNDVGQCLNHCKHKMYADDLQIYISGYPSELNSLAQKINDDLNALNKWAEALGLLLNPMKSQSLVIGSRNALNKLEKSSLPEISIGNSPVPWCSDVKNLGIHIDNTLSWTTQVGKICQKVFAGLHSLKRVRELLPINTRVSLVNSLIMPHFDYCDFLLTDLKLKQQRKLQIAQNACIRFIFDLRRYDHVSEFYGQTNILSIEKRRNFHSLLLLHKILNNCYQTQLLQNFKMLTLERSRSSRLLCIPRHNTVSYSKSFTVTVIRIWNSLPTYLKQISDFRKFKTRLSDWIK